MLFNSIEFAFFLPLVFMLYWLLRPLKLHWQNLFMLAASYLFYGWWNWKFLFLILLSSLVDYFIGRALSNEKKERSRKVWLGLSIAVNLGILGLFKYYDFFIQNFTEAFTFFGHNLQVSRLNLILPVGISFYTFQTLSYTIDVYKKKMDATNNLVQFMAFVSFFPQLVAGPIERSKNLLPQFTVKRSFNYAHSVDGLRQILWGLFKKVVIADNCALVVNDVFANYEQLPGGTLLVAAILFCFQIYGDFSGYSDMAIGIGKLFGFRLMKNFAFPFFSRDIAEFWRRWHISLSTWFRDYLYIPLGGSRGNSLMRIRNVFIIFLVSGFWHGANWTFIFWGGLNALYILPLILKKTNRVYTDEIVFTDNLSLFKGMGNILITFTLTCFAFIFFRAPSIKIAFDIIGKIVSTDLFHFQTVSFKVFPLLLIFILIEWLHRNHEHGLERIAQLSHRFSRWTVYYLIVISIIVFAGQQEDFIYFQF